LGAGERSGEAVCSASQTEAKVGKVSTGGTSGESPFKPKSNLRGDSYLLIARTIMAPFLADDRPTRN
jgi:hypothetical protein